MCLVILCSVLWSDHSNADAQSGQNDPFAFDFSQAQLVDDSWRWNGFLELRNQYADPRNEWLSNRQRALMESRYRGEGWQFFASGQAEYDPATTDYRSSTRFNVNEVYALFDGPGMDLTVGKQRVAWGVADGRSTIDRINAVDLREPIGNGRTSARRPSWVILLEHSAAIGIWEAVWLPRGRDRKLAEFGSPWEVLALHQLRRQAVDGEIFLDIEDPHKHEGGLRFTHYGQGLDWGLAVFDGFTDAPIVRQISGNRVTLRPYRIRTWNANMAVAWARSTLRAEFSFTENFPLFDGTTEPLTQVVLGWDRTYLTNLYFNMQVFLDDIEKQGRNYGVTFALNNKFFNDALEAGVRGQTGRQSQYAVEVYADYQVNDRLSMTVKNFAFSGDKGTELGEFGSNDFIELSMRYEF